MRGDRPGSTLLAVPRPRSHAPLAAGPRRCGRAGLEMARPYGAGGGSIEALPWTREVGLARDSCWRLSLRIAEEWPGSR